MCCIWYFIVNVHLNTTNETSNIGTVFQLAFGCVKHTANESYCHTEYNAKKKSIQTYSSYSFDVNIHSHVKK